MKDIEKRYIIIKNYLLENLKKYNDKDINKDDILFLIEIIPGLEKYLKKTIKKYSNNKHIIKQKILDYIFDWFVENVENFE